VLPSLNLTPSSSWELADDPSSALKSANDFLGFLAVLLGKVPESLKDDSKGKEILVDFLLLLILKAADIIEELGNFAPNNRISILWPRHGRRLERRTGD
jgi:hypothetical protein